jgi:hypothetical protein
MKKHIASPPRNVRYVTSCYPCRHVRKVDGCRALCSLGNIAFHSEILVAGNFSARVPLLKHVKTHGATLTTPNRLRTDEPHHPAIMRQSYEPRIMPNPCSTVHPTHMVKPHMETPSIVFFLRTERFCVGPVKPVWMHADELIALVGDPPPSRPRLHRGSGAGRGKSSRPSAKSAASASEGWRGSERSAEAVPTSSVSSIFLAILGLLTIFDAIKEIYLRPA